MAQTTAGGPRPGGWRKRSASSVGTASAAKPTLSGSVCPNEISLAVWTGGPATTDRTQSPPVQVQSSGASSDDGECWCECVSADAAPACCEPCSTEAYHDS